MPLEIGSFRFTKRMGLTSSESVGSTASPPRSARWKEEMDERFCPAQPRDWMHSAASRPFR